MSSEAAPVSAIRETWFWTGVFRDHATFIHDSLAPNQEREIRWAAQFQQGFQRLHEQVSGLADRAGIAGPTGSHALTGAPAQPPLAGFQGQELVQYGEQVQQISAALLEQLKSLRAFKTELLQRKLDCQVSLGLPHSLLSHMIVEAEEAERVLGPVRSLDLLPPPLQFLHHHLVWLPDASGHAAILHGDLDATEQQLLRTTGDFKRVFDGMHIKALELYSMLRIAPRIVGALRRLNRDSMAQIAVFRSFLEELREHTEGCEVLGRLVPLLPDHMLREELYYTEKITALGEGAPAGPGPA